MTCDRVCTADGHHLTNGFVFANGSLGLAASSGHYESMLWRWCWPPAAGASHNLASFLIRPLQVQP